MCCRNWYIVGFQVIKTLKEPHGGVGAEALCYKPEGDA
jgi:hypothetical protein